MISRIFRFSQAEARKAMVPLVRVDRDAGGDLARGRDRDWCAAKASAASRCSGAASPISSASSTFSICWRRPTSAAPVSDIMRPVSYFPESMPLDEVLVALQRTGENLSVIVDEYGGAAGILTVEDLLEEIVGDIEDEYDVGEELAAVVNPRMLSVMGRAPVTELNERFGLKLPEADEYATIGGLVVERLGHIPKPGEQLIEAELTITVTAQRRARGARTDADTCTSAPPGTTQAAMTEKRIREILDGVAAGKMTAGAAFKHIRELPFEDLGFAKLDTHRTMRRGIPEVVFGEGKTADQIAAIGQRVLASGTNLIITRLDADKARVVKRKIRALAYLARSAHRRGR